MLYTQLNKLTKDELYELHQSLTTAGLKYRLGTNWREVFRLKKHKYKFGFKHKLYALLENMSKEQLIDAEEAIINESTNT